jgi:CDP-diglyceride synthetase
MEIRYGFNLLDLHTNILELPLFQESSIKRQSKTKDSGSFLPGHGGILDRFDSSLLAVLFYTALLEYFQNRI